MEGFPAGLRGSSSEAPQISQEALTSQDEGGEEGRFRWLLPFAYKHISLLSALIFQHCFTKNLLPNAPSFKSAILVAIKIKKTRRQNSLFSFLPAPAALKE